HKEAAEPYVVPFQSDHPRHVFVNIIECALFRALRYSSTLKEFNHERRLIKLMLLYNGFVFVVSYLSQKLNFLFLLLVILRDIFILNSKNSLLNMPLHRHLFYP
ncbi:hypothetical protein DMUE_6114, partial [Dictyocoela muelleri]